MSLLTRLTSRNGKNVIAGLDQLESGGTSFHHYHVDFSNEGLTERIINLEKERHGDVYFALGSFKYDEEEKRWNRKQRNVVELKSFWLDIDCGERKYQKYVSEGKQPQVYRTRELGLQALKAFLDQTKIPSPTVIVSSGEGWHVYWELESPVDVTQWRFVANTFKAVTNHFGLLADNSRTSDPASVLRVPGTIHSASGNEVTVMKDTGVTYSFEQFRDAVMALKVFANVVPAPLAQLSLGKTPEWLKGVESSMVVTEEPRKFGVIIDKQRLEGSGCRQLYEMYVDQESVSQPMWAAGLSIIKFCDDADEWAVKFSENYSGYSHDETIKTMGCFTGPRTCAWFRDNNPSGCEGCPHAAGITVNPHQTPLTLGRDVVRAPVVVSAPIAVQTVAGVTVSDVREEFVIPGYPFPFFRDPVNGGVWRTNKLSDDAEETEDVPPTQVYPYDFYLHDRIGEGLADGAPRYWARLHTPHDGVMDLELTAGDIVAKGQKLIETLADKHIILSDLQAKDMSVYLRLMAAKMQRDRAMNHAPQQLGWTDKGTIVLGRTEYTKAGPRVAPVQGTVIAKMFDKACQRRKDAVDLLERWRQLLIGLYGAEDAGVYRLVLAAGFGSILRSRFALEKGGVLNIFSEDSGVGKTTLTRVLSAIYGDPDAFVIQAKHGTTNVAFFETISYLNSFPLVNDEIGQFNAFELMEFIHTCTSGKSKLRGAASSNDVRPTLPGWRAFVFSSSNVSIWNRISENRLENEAYVMRVAEFPIKRLAQSEDKSYGDRLVRELKTLHGVCAPVLLDYCVRNEESLRTLWETTMERLTKAAGLHSRYRFWADMLTSAAVGARVAYDLGLFPFDPVKVEQGCVLMLQVLRIKAAGTVMSDEDLLAAFFNSNVDKILITADNGSNFPILQPRQTVGIRIEPDTKYIYITTQLIVEFAKERGFDRSRIEGVLESAGATRVTKDIFRGTPMGLIGSSTRTWRVDTNHPKAQKLFNIQAYVTHIKETQGEASQIVSEPKSTTE